MSAGPEPVAVSVVVPARDASATLPEQLDALLGQVCDAPFEVIVADDGSTDGTVELVERRAAGDGRLRLVATSGGCGPAAARMRGVAAARGQLLAFCDADDVVAEGWLTALVATARTSDAVGGRLDHDRLNAPEVRVWRASPMHELPVALGFLPYAVSANFAVRRPALDAVDGWDETLPGAEDVDLSWRLQLAGYPLTFAPRAVVHYRHRPTLRGLWSQVVSYGVSEARLVRRFRDQGARGRSPRYVAGRVVYLVTRLPYLLMSTRRRGIWLVVAAGLWGRLKGSVRYRVWCA